jgi:beta-glucosidase
MRPVTGIDALLGELTLDEKAALTAGADFWGTVAIPRVGIPKVRLTDGPHGARGSTMGASGPTSAAVPCGTALGATWSPEVVEAVGALVGREARRKSAHVLLAPTVNLHRSPLAGRNFECYSEDPVLSGRLAAAYIRGAQSEGVAAVVKHLVGNDAEYDRHGISSVIDERALREVYLRPFELAVTEGGALGMMTSYNRVNGSWTTEQDDLLDGIVRSEWGFDGFVVTDWWGFVDTAGSARAGVDLEMPGPGRAFGPALAAAVRAGEVDEALVDAQVRRLLTAFDRVGALPRAGTPLPEGYDAEAEHTEESVDLPEERAVVRRAVTESIVLLANDGVLPLAPERLGTLAVIGPNAVDARLMGGGSSAVRPHHITSPAEAIAARLGDGVKVVVEQGCHNDKQLPVLGGRATAAPSGAGTGFDVEYYAGPEVGGEVVDTGHMAAAEAFITSPPSPVLPPAGWSLRARTVLTPPETGAYEVGLVQTRPARLLVDGAVVIDGFADRPAKGDAFYGFGSIELLATVELKAGVPVEVVVEHTSGTRPGLAGFRAGWRLAAGGDLVERAAAAAAGADAAVVVVGTTAEWETEGHDRASMDLPGEQDELVRRVIAANPRTVVVVNSGAPVTMDWVDGAAAVLQVWFGGQELSGGLAEVLFGDTDPGGRLPTTLPVRLEHNPSYGNFPGENGEVRYGEGLLVGYRWYDSRDLPTRFPFGHGLSYSTFGLGTPVPSSATFRPGETLTIDVPVTNTGDRRGAEVVQCYVAPPAPTRLTRPAKELRAFAKVWLEPGEAGTARLTLDDRAFAYWDPGQPDYAELNARMSLLPTNAGHPPRAEPGWQVDPGTYRVLVGRSSADIAHTVEVEVEGRPG